MTLRQEMDVPVAGEFDVIVCGGGVAGVAAAVAAARAGARTLLIERSGALGGTATASLMSLVVTPFEATHGFPREFFSALAERRGTVAAEVIPWDPEGYKLLAAEVCLRAGVTLLLYTWLSEPVVAERVVRGVVVENKSGRRAYLAKAVIDATGDADVVARAGARFASGREGDHAMRPVTVMGRFANVNLRQLREYVDAHPDDFGQDDSRKVIDLTAGVVRIDGFYAIVGRAKTEGVIDAASPLNYLRFSGVVQSDPAHADLICNSTRVYGVDGTDAVALSRAEVEGRRQLAQVVEAVRRYLPGFEQSYLIETSSQLGVRETRRVVGRYELTQADIDRRACFPDTVAAMPSRDYGTAEVHGPDPGTEGSASDRWAREMDLETIFFEFPFRCLVPADLRNVLVAGRCVSVTHDADRFVRNQVPAALTGQAAGTAAAIAASSGMDCADVPVQTLQRALSAQGVRLHAHP